MITLTSPGLAPGYRFTKINRNRYVYSNEIWRRDSTARTPPQQVEGASKVINSFEIPLLVYRITPDNGIPKVD